MKLFLTGGTGSVGIELLRQALDQRSFDEIRVLVRASSPSDLERRWSALLADVTGHGLAMRATRLRPCVGDVTRQGFGLLDADAEWLQAEATHVVHAAAVTDFNADLAQTVPINVEGTRQALALARRMRKLDAFAHVSTLYVAGRRTGEVREEDLDHDAGFINAYEQTKYEAERLVRASMPALPVSTYRLSLLVGRASDGHVHRTLEAHKMFELFASGRATRVPGAPSHTLDMLPTDYAARVLHDLVVRHFVPGETVQIAAGAAAPTCADLVDTFRLHLARGDWSVGWIDRAEWERLRQDDEGTSGLSPAAFWMFDVVADYLLLPKQFSRRTVDERFGPAAMPPSVLEYLPRVLANLTARNWGRA